MDTDSAKRKVLKLQTSSCSPRSAKTISIMQVDQNILLPPTGDTKNELHTGK